MIMKNISAALVLLAASTTFACPNLSGTYSCPTGCSTEQVTYSQSEAGGITTYVVNDSQGSTQLIADGKSYSDETSTLFSSYTCVGETVVSQTWSKDDSSDKYTEVISLDNFGNIQFSSEDGTLVTACQRVK